VEGRFSRQLLILGLKVSGRAGYRAPGKIPSTFAAWRAMFYIVEQVRSRQLQLATIGL
jgi:hypothetical protein